MQEVEPQPVRGDQRASLADVVAEHLAQRRVQQVGCRVIPHNRPPPLGVDRELHGVTDAQHAIGDLDVVEMVTAGVLSVRDHGRQARRGDLPGVAQLAAALGVAGGLVEHGQTGLARGQAASRPVRTGQGDDLPGGGENLMAEEPGTRGAEGRDDVRIRRGVPVLAVAGRPGGAGELPVPGEQLGEPRLVQTAPPLDGEVPDQVHRHAVGREQRERLVAGDLEAGPGVQRSKPVQAAAHHAAEVALLAGEQVHGAIPACGEPRVTAVHPVDHGGGHVAHVEVGGAGLGRDRDHLPQQPARNVAAALVRRDDALAEHERRRPHVIGDDPDVPLPGAGPGQRGLHGRDDGDEQVSLVRRVAVLQHHGHPLQAGTGVHAGEPQRLQGAAGEPVELHEHPGVPDLDVPAGAVELAARPVLLAVPGPGVIEHLGARPARPGIAGRPEVVLRAQIHDVVPGHADPLPGRRRHIVGPDAERVVPSEHGHVQVRQGEPEALGQQFEGQLDRALLEVVVDRPAAQHLEEREVVPVADVPDVDRAHARLHVAQVRGRGQRLTEEVGLERGHACVDEQQRGVVRRNQRGGLDPCVLPFGEESQKGLTDLVAAEPALHAARLPAPGRCGY